MRLAALAMLVACGNPPSPRPPSNHAVPSDAAVAPVAPDAPCANQCMDICCNADEVCSHGRLGDDTFPKCLRPSR